MSDRVLPATEPARSIAGYLWCALDYAEARHEDNTGIMDCGVDRARADCCSACAAAESIRRALREVGVHAFWQYPGRTVVVDDATCDRVYRLGLEHLPASDADWQRHEAMAAKRHPGPMELSSFDDVLREYYRPEDVGGVK